MRRINLSQDIKSLSDFRANAASYVQDLKRTKRPLVLTQNGRSSAILLDVAAYEAILEKIELLQDVQIARQQLEDGKGVDHNTAKQMIMDKLQQ